MNPVSGGGARDGAAEVGSGPLARWSAAVYWVLALEVLIVATSFPGLVPMVLLGSDPSNAPLVVLCFLPVGPSMAAAIFAWRDFLEAGRTGRDLAPARHFWRGYVLNALDVLKWWAPLLVLLAALAFNTVHADLVPAVRAFLTGTLVLGVALACWACNALVLTALFSLRTADVARAAVQYLGSRPVAGLGVLAIVVSIAGLTLLTSEYVVLAAASLLALLLLRNAAPMVTDVERRLRLPDDTLTP